MESTSFVTSGAPPSMVSNGSMGIMNCRRGWGPLIGVLVGTLGCTRSPSATPVQPAATATTAPPPASEQPQAESSRASSTTPAAVANAPRPKARLDRWQLASPGAAAQLGGLF